MSATAYGPDCACPLGTWTPTEGYGGFHACHYCGAVETPISEQGSEQVGEPICFDCACQITDDCRRLVFPHGVSR